MCRNEKLAYITLAVFVITLIFLATVGININVKQKEIKNKDHQPIMKVCPLYEMPVLPPAPVLQNPTAEVLNDKDKLASHLFLHIKEQRKYIENNRIQLQLAYDKYRQCHYDSLNLQTP